MEFDLAVAELDTLVATIERDDDQRALMLLQLIDAVHRPALALIAAGELHHPIAHALLAMYDLVDIDEQVQVEEALDEIRPYIESHGGELELLDVDDGVVHVRMSGACHGCAGSAMTLRRGIEEKLRERVPSFREIIAHDPEEPQADNSGLLQIEVLKRPVFADAGQLSDLVEGKLRVVEVDGMSILIAEVGGEPYAFKNGCPMDPDRLMPLDGAHLSGAVIVCPWHNCAYDARSGKRVDEMTDAPGLAVVPIAVRDGLLKVAVSVA